MKYAATIYPFLAVLLLGSCQKAMPVQEPVVVPNYTIEQFMDNETVIGSSFSPDGNYLLVTSDRSGIRNAYRLPVAGGEPEALTQSDSSSVYGLSYFPTDERVLLQMDNNGDEVWQLYVRDPDGHVRLLTQAAGARAQLYGWAHDNQSFFIGWSKRDPRFMDVYQVPVATLEPVLIHEMAANDNYGGISSDERYLAITRPINTNDADLFLYDLQDGQETKINDTQAKFKPEDFSIDNRYLYYTSDRVGEFSALYRYELKTGKQEPVELTNWDISYAYFSQTGKYRVTGINADGKTIIHVVDQETQQPLDLEGLGGGDISSVTINRAENLMAFYAGSSASPSNLFVVSLPKGEARQLTHTLNPAIDPAQLVKAEVVRFSSFDNLEVPAIYYAPHQASPANKVAALVWVHGGPGGQSRQSYNAQLQFLVNHGYAVLAVNNRGSSGYGKTFYQMDDQRHGEEDLKDCIAGKHWLAQQPGIDSTQIGILGGSYGGYMVMRAMTHTPKEFAVGVNLFGVTNWIRTLRAIPPWWESFKSALYQEMGDPNTADSVRLHDISPLFHPEQVQHPIMVLQGAQDPRVLQVESDEIVAAVKANNVPVEYVLFADEGHGFVKKENQQEAYSRILSFLDTYLKKKVPLAN
jgi:dipeptidyl aminopeptidase/acylaminoacyl peptidase